MLTLLGVFFFAFSALAMNGRTTYQAKIVKPDGYPLEAASVTFKFTVLDTVGSCVLYSETYSAVDMRSTGGLISFALGNGVRDFPASGTTAVFSNVFDNSINSMPCQAPGIYNPLPSDTRRIVMQFNDGLGWQTLPAMTINAVPYAMYANKSNDSKTLNGKADTAFVEYSTLAGLSCAADQAIKYNGVSFSCITVGSSDTIVTSSTVIAALGYTPVQGTSFTSLDSTVTSVSSAVYSVSSTVAGLTNSVTSLSNSVAASFAGITSSQWTTSGTNIFYDSGNVGIGTADPSKLLHVKGVSYSMSVFEDDTEPYMVFRKTNTVSSSRNIGLSYDGNKLHFNRMSDTYSWTSTLMSLTASGNLGIGTAFPVTRLSVAGGLSISMESAACSGSYAGTLRYNAGTVEYCNGTAWLPFGVAGSGITSLNSSTSGTQTFATGITGTDFNISSANGVHTFNIPLAASSSVTAGLLSNADYANFSNKLNATSAAVISALGFTPANSSGTLDVARLPAFSGDVSSSLGTSVLTLADVGAGIASGAQYTKVTVDGKGRVISGAQLSLSDVTTALGYTPANSSSSTQWTTSGTNIYYNTGSVGVGTTNPLKKLHVDSGAMIGTTSGFPSAYSTVHNEFNAGVLKRWTETSGNEVNLGVYSLVAPSATSTKSNHGLVNIFFTDVISGVSSTGSNNGFYNMTLRNRYAGNTDRGYVNSLVSLRNEYGHENFEPANAPSTGSVYGSLYMPHAQNGVIQNLYDLYLASPSGGGTIGQHYSFYQESTTAKNFFAGNVGIGITSPTAKLHLVAGTASVNTAPLKFTSGTLTTTAESGAMEFDGFNFYLTDGSNQRRTIATGSSSGSIDNAQTLNSSGNMSLNPNGSVIVSSTTASTSSDSGALIVKGGLGVAGNIYASGSIVTSANMQAASITATSGIISPYIYGSTAASGNITIDSTTNATKGNIILAPSGGRVGVGTATPHSQANLDVVGQLAAGSWHTWLGGNLGILAIPGDGTLLGTSVLGWNASNGQGETNLINAKGPGSPGGFTFDQWDGTSRTTRMVINGSTGNVGVGTTAPASRLHVAADEAYQLHLSGSSNENKRLRLGYDTTNNYGQIQALTFGSTYDNLILNPAGGNIGIGIVSPTSALHLKSSSSSIQKFDRASHPQMGFEIGGSASVDFGLYNYTNAAYVWRGIGSNLALMESGGSVGIGTTVPATKLDVAGTLGLYGGTLSGDSLQRSVIYSDDVNHLLIESPTVSGTRLNTYFSNRGYGTSGSYMMISGNSGNVGIGTTSPSSYQHGGTNRVTEILNSGTSANSQSHLVLSSGNTTNADSSIGTITFAQPNMTDANKGLALMAGRTDTDYTPANPTGLLAFWTRGSSESNWSQKMIIKGNGNVGIGTSAPAAQLHIGKQEAAAGTSGTANRLVIQPYGHTGGPWKVDARDVSADAFLDFKYGPNSVMTFEDSGSVGIGTASPAGNLHVYGASNPNIKLENSLSKQTYLKFINPSSKFELGIDESDSGGNNFYIYDATAGAHRFNISSSGNVGIGTTTPGEKLDVAGNMRVGNSESNYIAFRGTTGDGAGSYNHTYIGERFYAAGESSELFLFKGNDSDNTSGPDRIRMAGGNILFDTYNTPDAPSGAFESVATSPMITTKMIIKGNGNVGIGTTAPSSKLQVMGMATLTTATDTGINFSLQNTATNNTWNFYNLPSTDGSAPNGLLLENCNGGCTRKMTITQAGNVGIGTAAPTAKLDVRGHAAFGTTARMQIEDQTTFTRMAFNELRFWDWDTGTDALTISGNSVGIGTTSPGYTLDVAGTLRVTGQAYTNTGNGSFSILSDIRYKDVHGKYDRGLVEILKIDVIKFNYKKGNPLGSDSAREYVGISAQNLQATIPEAVEVRNDKGSEYLTVNTSPVLWTLINAVKQLYKKLLGVEENMNRQIASIVEAKADKTEIEELREKAEKLEAKAAKVDKLESENAALKAYLCSKDPAAPICK